DAQPLRRVDLIAHQRQQGRDDQSRPCPAVAEDACGDEIDRALTPAGALDHQQLPPVIHQRVDRFPLAVSEISFRVLQSPPEQLARGVSVRGARHSADSTASSEGKAGLWTFSYLLCSRKQPNKRR